MGVKKDKNHDLMYNIDNLECVILNYKYNILLKYNILKYIFIIYMIFLLILQLYKLIYFI